MGVSVTEHILRPSSDAPSRLRTSQVDTVTLTIRYPAADHVRRAWERLWSNECLDARERALRLETK